MAGKLVLITASFEHDSGLPQDAVVNTFHFNSLTATSVTGSAMQAIFDQLVDFYTVAKTPGTAGLTSFYSEVLTGHCDLKAYDLSTPAPRFPVRTGAFNATLGSAGNPLPSEVALCLSYQAAKVSGEDQAHKRGRIYLGPFQDTNTVNDDGTPQNGLVNAAAGAGKFLRTISVDDDYFWCVRSRVQDTALPVNDGWVDRAFDTQRRRGEKARSRLNWT
jgi:hypothetical protein